MRKILYIILILISSCKESQKISETIEEKFHLPKSEYVILTHKQDWFWVFSNKNQAEITPSKLSESELITIEKIVTIAINNSNKAQKKKLLEHNHNYPKDVKTKTGYEINLDKYQRQYVPILNALGEKEVWVNFFCKTSPSDKWHTNLVSVEDGGNCYFNIKINLNAKKYYDFDINRSI
ncbi:hypothetical protein [Maribacter sp. Asnod2-G09]|uniref:hypothetical protein n=1 Tax=Maribacter sp. Asnod2-G09 TaxID=3160577 RepID=UPI00386326E4